MILELIKKYICGSIKIEVEGFFIERFLNLCKIRNVSLNGLIISDSGSSITAYIYKQDLEIIDELVHITKLNIVIKNKKGLPFLVEKYKKRKIFVVYFILLLCIINFFSSFIWRIEILVDDNEIKTKIHNILVDEKINIGSLKKNVNINKLTNDIRMNDEDIAWVGIKLEGCVLFIDIEKNTKHIMMKEKNNYQNIIANKKCKIKKIIVQSGTPLVSVGDDVEKGQVLVEAVMKSDIYGTRNVDAEAIIFGENIYEISKTESFLQKEKIKTGNKEIKNEICLKKFKIYFNKRVSKFKFYDKISTNKKFKINSNFYLPFEINNYFFEEFEYIEKCYSDEELKRKIINELDDEFIKNSYNYYLDKDSIEKEISVDKTNDNMTVNIKYTIIDEIGIK